MEFVKFTSKDSGSPIVISSRVVTVVMEKDKETYIMTTAGLYYRVRESVDEVFEMLSANERGF